MNTRLKLLIGAVAAAGFAAPAAAQTHYPAPQAYPQYQVQPQHQYPQYQYPQTQYGQVGYAYPGQPAYGQQNVLGQMINQMLGNRYNVADRNAVTQCASAAMTQASAQYNPRGHGQPPYGNAHGYHRPGNPAAAMRVTAITDVRRQNRGVRVSGQMSSGMHSNYIAPGMPGYSHQRHAAAADLNFRCNVAYNGQVTNVRIGRNATAYRR